MAEEKHLSLHGKYAYNTFDGSFTEKRKSLNKEAARRTQENIRISNLKFLSKIQNLQSNYDVGKLIKQHKERGELV